MGRAVRILMAVAAVCALGAGFAPKGLLGTDRASADAAVLDAWEARLAEARSGLAAARPGYVVLMGDSNAQLVAVSDIPCPGDVVNFGVGGTGAAQYLALARRATFPDGGAAAVVNVGTNDLIRKRRPEDTAALDAYEHALSGIVGTVGPHVSRVVVNAIPPMAGRFSAKLMPELVEAYSLRAKAVCERLGCTYVDPWAGIREGGFGAMRPDAAPDGLHPSNPGSYYAAQARHFCPRG